MVDNYCVLYFVSAAVFRGWEFMNLLDKNSKEVCIFIYFFKVMFIHLGITKNKYNFQESRVPTTPLTDLPRPNPTEINF